MKNIDTAFRQMRLFFILVVVGCFSVTLYMAYLISQQQHLKNERLYILYNGKILEAYASGRKDNVAVEAKDHVKMFHQYFFSLDPDEKVIKTNIKRALYLADGSARQQYDNLQENGYYAALIAANISQQVEADSIIIKTGLYPYYFRYYGHETLVRPSAIVTRSLVTEGYLRNVSRSDNNSHGFLIEKWRTLENNDIKIVNR